MNTQDWSPLFLSTVLIAVEAVRHKEMSNNQDVPSKCHHASICDNKGGRGLASEEKVIFVLKIVGPILPFPFHRFHKRNI